MSGYLTTLLIVVLYVDFVAPRLDPNFRITRHAASMTWHLEFENQRWPRHLHVTRDAYVICHPRFKCRQDAPPINSILEGELGSAMLVKNNSDTLQIRNEKETVSSVTRFRIFQTCSSKCWTTLNNEAISFSIYCAACLHCKLEITSADQTTCNLLLQHEIHVEPDLGGPKHDLSRQAASMVSKIRPSCTWLSACETKAMCYQSIRLATGSRHRYLVPGQP